MSEPKTRPTDVKVEDFLNTIQDEQKRKDSFVVLELMKKVTKCEPIMWGPSIVGFGTYTYKYASGQEMDWPMVGFSPRKQSLTLYIARGFDNYDALMQKLGKHSTSPACLYIKRLSDIDMPTLEKLVKESCKYLKARPKLAPRQVC
jgi:hypothetical protein